MRATDAREFMREKLKGGRLLHAYIISGGRQEDRDDAAGFLAETALCEGAPKPCGRCAACQKVRRGVHPDVTRVEREKDAKEIKIAAARDIRAQAGVLPNEGAKSVFIVNEADVMNTQAQNALLKVLEESAEHAVFVLLCRNPERLLKTVQSRCAELTLPAGPEEEQEEPLFNLSSAAEKVRRCGELEKLPRPELMEAVAAIKRQAVKRYAAGALSGARFAAIAENMDKAEKYMAANVGGGHISGLILAAFL